MSNLSKIIEANQEDSECSFLETEKKLIEYSGKIRNKAIDYTLRVKTIPLQKYDKSKKAGALLSDLSDLRRAEQVYTGQMIIKNEYKSIAVMEKDSKGKISFYEMVALE